MSRCHHGTIIHDSWQDCSQCWDEHDAAKAADAASDSLDEQRKQTALMEQILKNQQEILKKKS